MKKKLIQEEWIDTMDLLVGNHLDPMEGACVMEWLSMKKGAEFSDALPCVSSILRGVLLTLNDGIDDTKTRNGLKEYGLRCLGTRPTTETKARINRYLTEERTRACMVLNWLVSTALPKALYNIKWVTHPPLSVREEDKLIGNLLYYEQLLPRTKLSLDPTESSWIPQALFMIDVVARLNGYLSNFSTIPGLTELSRVTEYFSKDVTVLTTKLLRRDDQLKMNGITADSHMSIQVESILEVYLKYLTPLESVFELLDSLIAVSEEKVKDK